MRIIYILPLLLFADCNSTSNQGPTETPSTSLTDTDITTGMIKQTSPELPELKWSQFLGHFFKYIPYDTFRYELPEVSKIYYDIRFDDNSLAVMKCQDIGKCEDKFGLTFTRISEDSIIFQTSKTNGIQNRTFSFYQNSVFVNEPNESTKNREIVRYDAYRPNDEEEEYSH